MRTWAMISIAAVLVVLPLAVRSQAPHPAAPEDCTKRATQKAQIACLQASVSALRQEVEALRATSEVDLASHRRRHFIDGSLEAMIDRKIHEAMEPKLRLLERR
jgi:hypothetical protein